MDVCQDYEDLFKILNAWNIKYLVVGGQAVIYYSRPRYTKDMDVWIPCELNDSKKVHDALREFGAPLKKISPKDFTDPKMILQIGVAPVRIVILIKVPGLTPNLAWKNRKKIFYGKTPVHLLGVNELVKSKKKAGRLSETLDIQVLKASTKKKNR